MPITEVHKSTLAQFFQANVVGRLQAQQQDQKVDAWTWLAEFWLKTPREQEKQLAEWAEQQRASVQAAADRQLAALDDLKAQTNGNRAERRRAARVEPADGKAAPAKRAVKAKPAIAR